MPGARSSGELEAARCLAALRALSAVLAEPGRLLDVLAAAADDDDALVRLRAAYGIDAEQAEAVLDLQFRRVTQARRARLDDEVARVAAALEAPWDPPLEVETTVLSPQRVEVVLGGTVHRVEGTDLANLLDRLIALVGTELAGPERRRVAVRLDMPDGPALALVDDLGGAELRYDDDAPAS